MRWLVYSLETGAELRRVETLDAGDLAEGEGAARIPASATAPSPLSEWNPEARAFTEIERRGGPELVALFTTEELAAMLQTGPLDILRLLLAIALVRVPIRASEPFFVAGVGQAAAAGFLTGPRAAAILAFQEPAS
jgi:hypothetical protein